MAISPSGRLPLCYIVDDEPAIGRLLATALNHCGATAERFVDVGSMMDGLRRRSPDLIFLDISLGNSDAIDAIRGLAEHGFAGVVQLMSGNNRALLDDVRQVGERHGLRMRAPLAKPFLIDAIERIVAEERVRPGEPPHAASPAPADQPDAGVASPARVDLREALDNNWVEFWYQPKVDLRSGRVVGAEGLARVRHPERGIVPPQGFLPDAAAADQVALAEHALGSALAATAEFAAAGHTLQLAINVPVEALIQLPIPAIVRDHRMARGDWPGIILEITEDQVVRDIPTVHEIATQLRIYRVSLAIDDFGRGYSSLARLKELPFAELKLDRSFVGDCSRDAGNAEICRTVVGLAHRFGSLAVAEGIETAEDLATIQDLGCDVAQGFLFAHAMPKAFLLAQLEANLGDHLAALVRTDRELRTSA